MCVDVINSVGNLLFVACILTIGHQEMEKNVEDKFSSFILLAIDFFLVVFLDISYLS